VTVAFQLQLLHHSLHHCSTKRHARNHWGALHPSRGWGERSHACFCGGPKSARALFLLFPSCHCHAGRKTVALLEPKAAKPAEKKSKASPKGEAGTE